MSLSVILFGSCIFQYLPLRGLRMRELTEKVGRRRKGEGGQNCEVFLVARVVMMVSGELVDRNRRLIRCRFTHTRTTTSSFYETA